jgi:hypothetical protein
MSKLKKTRPDLNVYLWILVLLIAFWLGYVWHIYQQSIVDGVRITGMAQGVRQGIARIIAVVLLVFSGHWVG